MRSICVRAILLAAGASAAFAQVTLQDWKCAEPQLTAGSPTVITCPGGHGFRAGTSPRLSFWGGAGNWHPLNTMRVARTLDYFSAADTEIRIDSVSQVEAPVTIIVGLSTTADERITCATKVDYLTLGGCTRAVNGIGPNQANTKQIYLYAGRVFDYVATVVNDTTLTIPFDSTGFGPAPAGIHMEWNSDNHTPFARKDSNASAGYLAQQNEGVFSVQALPRDCSTYSYFTQCAVKQTAVDASGSTQYKRNIVSYSVSGGVGSVTVDATMGAWLAPGYPVYISGMDDADLNGWHPVLAKVTDTRFTISLPGEPDGARTFTTATATLTDASEPFAWLFYPRIGSTMQKWKDWAFKEPTGWNPTVNRVHFTARWTGSGLPERQQALATGSYMGQFGTYSPAHWYHYAYTDLYRDTWYKVVATSQVSHLVGAGGDAQYPYDVQRNGHVYNYNAAYNGLYFGDEMREAYFRLDTKDTVDLTNASLEVGPVRLYTVNDEPDAFFSTAMLSWNANRVLTNDPGYTIGWWSYKYQPVEFEVRWSTTDSLKNLGWSAGQCKGGVCDADDIVAFDHNSDYSSAIYRSATMADQGPQIWWGIRPRNIGLLGVSGAGVSPIWLITYAWLNYSAGETVTVAGVTGNTAANQTNVPVVASRQARTWQLETGELASLSAAAGVCTAGLNVNHNLTPGWVVQVRCSTNSTLGTTHNRKFYTVTATPTANSFKFSCPGVPDGDYSADFSTVSCPLTIMSLPGVAVGGDGDGDWTGGGTISPTGEGNFFEISFSEPPSPPVLAASPSFGSVLLSWTDSSAGESGFIVEMDDGTGFAEVASLPPDTTSYTVGGLAPAHLYSFRVKELAGGGLWSNVVTVPTGASVRARLASPPRSSSVALHYIAPSAAPCTIRLELSEDQVIEQADDTPFRTRSILLTGLLPESSYAYEILCGAAGSSGIFATSAVSGGNGDVSVRAARPGQADNFVVEYGSTSDSLTGRADTACSSSFCTLTFSHPADSGVWVRRRWCRNRAADPACANPANELSRSSPELITPR